MDIVRWYPNERVGIPDFEAATGNLILEELLRRIRSLFLPANRVQATTPTGEDTQSGARIISGFDFAVDTPSPGQVQINIGAAIVPFYNDDDGTLAFGLLIAEEGSSTKILDFSSASDGTHNLWVRFAYTDANQQNRVFWDADGPNEFVDSVQTRRAAEWQADFRLQIASAPGNGEWFKIGEVTTSSGSITGSQDRRHFFFEGLDAATTPYAHEWGDGANDRNADRSAYGVNDLHMVLQAVRRQLADIIGGSSGGFWDAAPNDLTSLDVEHYSQADEPAANRGEHKQVTFAGGASPSTARHRLSSAGANGWNLTSLDEPSGMRLAYLGYGAGGDAAFSLQPRGGPQFSNGDVLNFDVGADDGLGTPDFTDKFTRTAVDDYDRQWQFYQTTEMRLNAGAGATRPGLHVPNSEIAAGTYFRLETPQTVKVNVPLQWMTTMVAAFGDEWVYQATGPENQPVYLSTNGNTLIGPLGVRCWFELVLPHNALLNVIRVMWEQPSASGGSNNVRLYAQKHAKNQVTAGLVGGGTGSPTLFNDLKTVNNYIEHPVAGGGGSSPYLRIDEFTCNESTVLRTFDIRQHKLVITLVGPDDTPNAKVYGIELEYDLDYVTPPV